MVWRAGLSRRAIFAAACSLVVTAVVLVVALTAAASARGASRELSQRLVPSAVAAGTLLKEYNARSSELRDYVTSGVAAELKLYNQAGGGVPATEAHLASLIRGYPKMPTQLTAAEAAERAWLRQVAAPQLAAAARGDFATARALQANIPATRPYSLAIRDRMTDLQDQITFQQQVVTARLVSAQTVMFWALVAMCVLVAIIAAGGVVVVRRWLLRPFAALRVATENVAAGQYDDPIPIEGPAEFSDLARSTEHMRTQLVTALAERERAEHGFRQLFESAPDATLAVDPDGIIVIANAQAESLFGYPPGELTGNQVDTLVPEHVRGTHAAHRSRYFTDPESRPMGAGLQLSAVRRDGSTFPVEISLSGLPTDSGMVVTAAIRDISERLAIQQERERLQAEAEKQRNLQRLQQSQKLESLGQLVGGVAHDFNNLLNIITGYTDLSTQQIREMAGEDPRLEPVLSDISQVKDAAGQAIRVTRQLLTFARHDVIKPEVINLNNAVSGAGQMLQRSIGEHIDLEVITTPDLWPIKADPGQLEQVLVNLAVNARDAMPRGGKLRIDTANIDVDAAYAAGRPGLRPGPFVRLRVSDTGTGMDQATIERVFEPFFTTKAKGHGTGLGLATVYGIITQAGGTVQIYSEPGLGTTINVLFPATQEAPKPRDAATSVTTTGQGQGECILLVEDEQSLRVLAHRILTRHGYAVHQADSGPDAVQYAADRSHHLDLLLTDVVMPDMLGTEVAHSVKQHRPGLPVVFMSGYAQPILDTHGATGPEMNILEKPFTETSLLARVQQALQPHSESSAAGEP
jgi:hypothetical protein